MPDSKHTPLRLGIGVDVGGTSTKFALVTSQGDIVDQTSLPTPAFEGATAVLDTVARGVAALRERADRPIAGVGVGVPGVVNDLGEVAYPPNFPGWGVVNVRRQLREQFGINAVVENDANVAAYAEARAGNLSPRFLYVTLGTGVGGCIIHNGEIWRGGNGGAGEIGHTTIDINGQLCNCGARGCIEAYIGQRYMSALAAERLERDPDSMLHAWIATGHDVEPRLLDDAAMSGDRFAIDFLAEMGDLLGAALASAMNLLDIPIVVVGGGMSRAEQSLLVPARRSLSKRLLKTLVPKAELRVARFGNEAGMIGAALMGIQNPMVE